jgi:glutathione synthase/RimK-type ligase-like ATP-grasp enzyme
VRVHVTPRLATLYEHPRWFEGLFAELRSRGIAFEEWKAESLALNPERTEWPDLVLNRMSPSARWRDHGCGQFAVLEMLRLLEARRVEVINGSAAYEVEISKLRQLEICRRCGVAAPRTRAVNCPKLLMSAAAQLRFPVIVKPNCGGAGSAMQRFDSAADLGRLAEQLDFGADSVALVQEYHAPRGGFIQRVEVLGGEVLYALRIEATSFNLCPADACTPAQRRVERFEPSPDIATTAIALARAARLDVGGVEYLEDASTGETLFYDINALSNFIANAESVVGFNPTARFVDYLERRLDGLRWARR